MTLVLSGEPPRILPFFCDYTVGMRGFAFLFAAAVAIAAAQTSGDLKFEVASVKPAVPDHDVRSVTRLGPGTSDPERIIIDHQSLLRFLVLATGTDWDQIQAPQWTASELYTVNAKVPPGTTKEQVRVMWMNLLVERFNMKFHYITKEFPVYELTVAKNGSKLKKSGENFVVPVGFPAPPGDSRHGLASALPRNVRQTFLAYSMAEFCQTLAWNVAEVNQSGYVMYMSVGRVIDKTGLAGTYNFTLEFAGRFQSGAYPDPLPDGQMDTAPFLFDALRQQLGLELLEKKESLPVLVVDHLDKAPTEN